MASIQVVPGRDRHWQTWASRENHALTFRISKWFPHPKSNRKLKPFCDSSIDELRSSQTSDIPGRHKRSALTLSGSAANDLQRDISSVFNRYQQVSGNSWSNTVCIKRFSGKEKTLVIKRKNAHLLTIYPHEDVGWRFLQSVFQIPSQIRHASVG